MNAHARAARAWHSPLTVVSLSLLLYLVVSGLAIFFLPFSAFNQYSVLIHTIAGIAFLAPYVLYQWRHLKANWNHKLWYVSVVGYTGGAALLVTVVSGVVLTVQAAFGTRISYAWDLAHIIAGLSTAVLVLAHVLEAILIRTRADRVEEPSVRAHAGRAGRIAALVTAALVLLALIPSFFYTGLETEGSFPPDYGYKYGDNPFAPSLAMTSTGGALNAYNLAGSKRCGDAGCHEEIVHEWEPSAHRYASRSVFFQIVQKAMAENNGPESTRYCAGCHDPIALFSGAKNIYNEDLSSPGADEGVSCIVCHAIKQTDVKGNANYVLEAPKRYLFEESEGALGRFLAGFLIRSYPRHHVASLNRDLLKTPEFCGACHKQFIDEEVNNVGWVQLQNQYDNWRKSHWFHPSKDDPEKGDPTKTITCRECHMRLTDSRDPAAGDAQDYNRSPDDGKHRNHRFIGANQWHPKLHNLPGWEEQIRLTEEWLRGETEIPEIADKWTSGPVVKLDLVAPEAVKPGEELTLYAITTSNKVGHDFPTGPLDIIQSWIELIVTDESGREIFSSGKVDEKGFIQEGAFVFKAEGVDQAGNLIDRHNLWDMVGARFRRSLFPGFSDKAEYTFACPSTLARVGEAPPERTFRVPVPKDEYGVLKVKARLRYRKVDQTLINYLAPDSGLTAPITDMAFAEATIRVVPPEAAAGE